MVVMHSLFAIKQRVHHYSSLLYALSRFLYLKSFFVTTVGVVVDLSSDSNSRHILPKISFSFKGTSADMGGRGGRPVEEGAKGIVWAATLPDNGPTAGFFFDGKPAPW